MKPQFRIENGIPQFRKDRLSNWENLPKSITPDCSRFIFFKSASFNLAYDFAEQLHRKFCYSQNMNFLVHNPPNRKLWEVHGVFLR